MTPRRELAAFALILGGIVAGFFWESLFAGKVLSPADVLFVSASFREWKGAGYEPANRLLMDPVLQFQPWLEFNRSMLRQGRLPLWNDLAGCGAPHLANSQSAVFDPFNAIGYLGALPGSYALTAVARLWFAGLGMFLLAHAWGLGRWGAWFAGLTFPLTGFLVVWLLFPVTNVAVWTPWVFLATHRVFASPSARRVGCLGLAVGGLFLGGHVQTSAHVLLGVGLDVAWRLALGWRGGVRGLALTKPVAAWSLGVALGLTLGAVSIVPLWHYLGKSPVWADRDHERASPWRLPRPRVLDAFCTAVPDAFGSQRRDQPNLARALGVHNFNESAGGFAGLATLLWLVPQALAARRGDPRVRFLAGLAAIGFLGAFGFPPVANLLRLVPILNVTDLRRLTLWVAFTLPVLGGVGLDNLAVAWSRSAARWWLSLTVALTAALALGAGVAPRFEPRIRAYAERHYLQAALTTDGVSSSDALARADRQVRLAASHVPQVLWRTAAEIAGLGALAVLAHRRRISWSSARGGLLVLTVAELFRAGFGLNPALDRRDDRPVPPVIARLREEVGASGRVLGLGQELLPNVAMRYGLADIRNYDSVELSRSLGWFSPLYEAVGGSRTSRRQVNWKGVVRALDRLRGASVAAVVASSPPPVTLNARTERLGPVWIAWLDAEPIVSLEGTDQPIRATIDHGRINAVVESSRKTTLIVRQTYDLAWSALVDGDPAEVKAYRGAFLSIRLGAGRHVVALRYDPPEVRAACAASLGGLAAALAAVLWQRPARRSRFRVVGLGRCQAVGLESIP